MILEVRVGLRPVYTSFSISRTVESTSHSKYTPLAVSVALMYAHRPRGHKNWAAHEHPDDKIYITRTVNGQSILWALGLGLVDKANSLYTEKL